MASPLTNFYISNNCSGYPGGSCDATMTKLLADFVAGYRSRLVNLIQSSFRIFWNVQLTAA